MKHGAAGKSNEAAILVRLSKRFSPARERAEIRSRFLLDTSLSSTPISSDSTRHSVTSRIDCNSRAFCYLIFSTRHLNATRENSGNVEKFNIRIRFLAASASFPEMKIARRSPFAKISTSARAGCKALPRKSGSATFRPPGNGIPAGPCEQNGARRQARRTVRPRRTFSIRHSS